MEEQQLDKKQFLESANSKDKEIDLIDIFRRIITIRRKIYKAAGVGLVVGIIIAISIPKQYTVNVTLSPEMGGSRGNSGLAGLATSFLGVGATTGDVSDALNASLSSEIIISTPFLMELLDSKIPLSSEEDKTTLAFYLGKQSVPWWNHIISFPGMIFGGIRSIFKEEVGNVNTDNINVKEGIIELSKEDNRNINILRNSLAATVDNKTAITNITVTLQEPKVAAIVADSVVCKLQEYIINYRTSKAKEDCIYLEKLFRERQQEYYTAQKKYANYVDTHDNLVLQSVRAEQEKLQNDMNLSYQIYSQVANQLQVARAKVQEEKPVFAVVEPAVVPQYASSMGLRIYVLLFIFLFVCCTISWNLLGKKLWYILRNSKDNQ